QGTHAMPPARDPQTATLSDQSEPSSEVCSPCDIEPAARGTPSPKRPRRFWRVASPSALLLALLVFPLPWVQIQCDRKPPSPRNFFNDVGLSGQPWDSLSFWERDSVTLLEQSGLEAALGVCSPTNDDAAKKANRDMRGSPWMAVYPVIVVLGVV